MNHFRTECMVCGSDDGNQDRDLYVYTDGTDAGWLTLCWNNPECVEDAPLKIREKESY